MSDTVALITGASSGIGRAGAIELARRGYVVYAGARRLERMEDLREHGIRILSLDVADDSSRRAAVARIHEETGRIDLLVNNAGYGAYGSLEEVPLGEGRQQFEVNLFGAIALTQLVIPSMRTQNSGRIVNVTSVGGKVHTPFGSWYHGTKFALEGMSDVLRIELKPFGIDVVVIEPGAIKTEWSGIAVNALLESSGRGPYRVAAEKLAARLTTGRLVDHASDPSVIVDVIVTAATVRRPRARYAAGSGARVILALRRLVPDRTFDRLVALSMR